MHLRFAFIFMLCFILGAPEAWSQDKAPDVVTLEVNVVQIILNDEHRAGVDWGAIVSDYHTVPLKKESDPLWSDKKYRLSFGTVSQDDYTVLLDALDMAGQMNQYSQPPLKITTGATAGLDFSKQDIHLDVWLSRLKSGDLSLAIDPQVATAAAGVLKARTRFMAADNTTIVIGGFIKEEEIKRTRKFPLLGDIPIVGLVFRSRGRLMQKTETVIFLTERTNAVEPPQD